MSTFEKELECLISKNRKENESDTPDFILAEHLFSCLLAYRGCRELWHGTNEESAIL